MSHFICLLTFTQQGLSELSKTTARTAAFAKLAEEMGVTIEHTFWTLGAFDIVAFVTAPDEKTAAALAFSLSALGNVRTHTLPAFTLEEMNNEILTKVQTPYDLLRVETK